MINIKSDVGTSNINGHPDSCPFCHKTVTPNVLFGHLNDNIMEVTLICPNQECKKSFIGYYEYQGSYYHFNGQHTIGNLEGKIFSDTINKISENFIVIYNQAFIAEQQELLEICGVGYRKSLEFLIKDYLKFNLDNPIDRDKIDTKLLSQCIADDIDDKRIKTVARMATWLGNDEAHYVRKWEGKSLGDLKKLIELTVHWIEMESLTKSFAEDMSE